jgi:hypothetical protein
MRPGPYASRRRAPRVFPLSSEPNWPTTRFCDRAAIAFRSQMTFGLLWLPQNRSQRKDLRPVIPRYSWNRDHADGHSFAINIFIPERRMTAVPHEVVVVPNTCLVLTPELRRQRWQYAHRSASRVSPVGTLSYSTLPVNPAWRKPKSHVSDNERDVAS